MDGKELTKMRIIEVEVRSNLSKVIRGYAEFMRNSNLRKAAELLKTKDRVANELSDFFKARDEAELAWHLIKEYIEEENSPDWQVIGEVRAKLNEIDDIVLFDYDIVQALQQIGQREVVCYCDYDFFWWLPRPKGTWQTAGGSDTCYLPAHRCSEYVATYVENPLGMKDFELHLAKCSFCSTQVQILRA